MDADHDSSAMLEYSEPEPMNPECAPLWIADFIACFVAGLGLFYLWGRLLHKNPATIFVALPSMVLFAGIWATCRPSNAPHAGVALAVPFALAWTLMR